MEPKLTLRIEEKLIVRAKSFAERTGKSVSQIVADFFELLPEPEARAPRSLAPIVSSLVGVLRGADVDEEDYRKHLEEKYL